MNNNACGVTYFPILVTTVWYIDTGIVTIPETGKAM